jgi:hypothetical protein
MPQMEGPPPRKSESSESGAEPLRLLVATSNGPGHRAAPRLVRRDSGAGIANTETQTALLQARRGIVEVSVPGTDKRLP